MSTRLAAASAILIGLFDVLLVIYVVAVPQGQRYEMGQIFVNYAENPLTMNVAWIVLIITSLLALPVVPVVARWLRSAHSELVQSVSLLALLGYGVAAASFLTMLGQMPDLAAAYVAGDSATQGAIAAFGPPQLTRTTCLCWVASASGSSSSTGSRCGIRVCQRGTPGSGCCWP
ncbi:MAG: hypothetical protein KC547_11295 [Anaerolineae bacterium]|nr:hypothetical protein [Anaerolineae bacterium]